MQYVDWIKKEKITFKEGEINLLHHKADFVKGGIIKIKQYYLETNKIPEIRGASLLLDMINSEKMKELVGQMHVLKCRLATQGKTKGESAWKRLEGMNKNGATVKLIHSAITRTAIDYRRNASKQAALYTERISRGGRVRLMHRKFCLIKNIT